MQKLFHSLLHESEIELCLVNKDKNVHNTVLCKLQNQDLSLRSCIKSNTPLIFDNSLLELTAPEKFPGYEFKMNCSIENYNSHEANGQVRDFFLKSQKGFVDKILYDLAGTGGSPFIVPNFNWKRTYNFETDIVEVEYKFIRNIFEAKLSQSLSLSSEICNQVMSLIEDEVSMICWALAFCRSSKVEWVLRRCIKEGEISEAHYKYSNAVEKFPNQINPMRQEKKLWFDFLNHVIKRNFKKEQFVKSGIFQAIINLSWPGNLNEWSLICHAAALEGLCKDKECNVICPKTYKKLRNSVLSEITKEAKNLGIEDLKIDKLKTNFLNNQRSLNGFPTKWYLESKMKEHHLEKFCQEHLVAINEAIKMRNVVVHTGWSSKWENSLFQHITILRNAIYVLVFSFFDYDGDFFLVGNDNSTNLKNYA